MRNIVFAISAILLLCSVVTAAPLQKVTSGKATVYYQNGTISSCGKNYTDKNFVVRLSKDHMDPKMCGKVIWIESQGRIHNATVAGLCKICSNGSLELSAATFKFLAPAQPKVIPIKWSTSKPSKLKGDYYPPSPTRSTKKPGEGVKLCVRDVDEDEEGEVLDKRAPGDTASNDSPPPDPNATPVPIISNPNTNSNTGSNTANTGPNTVNSNTNNSPSSNTDNTNTNTSPSSTNAVGNNPIINNVNNGALPGATGTSSSSSPLSTTSNVNFLPQQVGNPIILGSSPPLSSTITTSSSSSATTTTSSSSSTSTTTTTTTSSSSSPSPNTANSKAKTASKVKSKSKKGKPSWKKKTSGGKGSAKSKSGKSQSKSKSSSKPKSGEMWTSKYSWWDNGTPAPKWLPASSGKGYCKA